MKLYTSLFLLLLLTACAKKGQPDGGPKDEDAPVLVVAKPAYRTTNFSESEIRFYFDEYIVLKDLNTKLIISPPLKNAPIITPQGTATKNLKIQIIDTLKPNTTYTFNFGDAIQDNNENNKLENFKYVFSTGNYIDSLTTSGTISDALNGKLNKNVSVVLYELDTSYTDSTFLKRRPNYVTNTIDSVNFTFSNLKKGNYLMMALDEQAIDYIFNPRDDKVAYITDTIRLPSDSIVNKKLQLFKETGLYKFKKGKQIVNGKIEFGFTGKQENMKATLLSEVPEGFTSFSQIEKDRDTLSYWHSLVELDSLNFVITNKEIKDTVTIKLRKEKIDSLTVSSTVEGTLHLLDTLFLKTNNPITAIDESKFSLEKDSTLVAYTLKKEAINKIALLFENEPKTSYKLTVLPEAITDLYKTTNDSLSYKFKTKEKEDYGSISLKIENNVKKPLIIELLLKDNVYRTQYINDESQEVSFNLLDPKEYTIRAVIDKNNNKKWDTGNFLNKIQPERIIYFEKTIELRANWVINESFIIK